MKTSWETAKDTGPQINQVSSNANASETHHENVTKKRKRRNILASSLRSSFTLCSSSKKKKTKHLNDDKGNLYGQLKYLNKNQMIYVRRNQLSNY